MLGAGLTGVSTALELAKHGCEVTLIEQDQVALNRASLRNEGKIHLGFIYAQDRSLATARLQLTGALHFRSLLKRWIGDAADRLLLSTPFVYLVAKDSMLSPAELGTHYAAVESLYRELMASDPGLDYLGTRPVEFYRSCNLDELVTTFRIERFSAAFRTAELAINTEELAGHMRDAIGCTSEINFLSSHKVAAVTRYRKGFQVVGIGPQGAWTLEAAQVVNALGNGRFAIDRSVGLEPAPGWLHRLKYRIIARLPEELRGSPSATMVLGPYGDVVVRPDGTAYLSWYPLGLKGWTHDLAPPSSWEAACKGQVGAYEMASIAAALTGAIEIWYPGIAKSTPLIVDAGVIVAYGYSDIDNKSSGLHDRTRVGVTSVDGYHSVEPGKLTTAPFFAKMAADHILAYEASSG